MKGFRRVPNSFFWSYDSVQADRITRMAIATIPNIKGDKLPCLQLEGTLKFGLPGLGTLVIDEGKRHHLILGTGLLISDDAD